MVHKQESTVEYNKRLLHKAIEGDKDSFRELKFNAGAGNIEAQLYLAQYYARENDDDFRYWIKKAIVDNKFFEREEALKSLPEVDDTIILSFSEAVKTCFAKYAVFTGRATPSELWWFFIFNLLIFLPTGIFIMYAGLTKNDLLFYITMTLSYVAALALTLPNIAVSVRRLHDIGKSGWWMLLNFIPYIGGFILLYYLSKRSGPDNIYGKRLTRK